MKTSLLLLLSLATSGIFITLSCTPEHENPTTTYLAPDLWIGTYTVDQLPAQQPLSQVFAIKPDGKLLAEGKGANGLSYYSAGTWTLTGDSLKCTYTSLNAPGAQVTQTAKFFYNPSTGKLSDGTWKDIANASNTGKFPVMARVN